MYYHMLGGETLKKKFESPAIETCKFAVAARLNSSGSNGGTNTDPNGNKNRANSGNPCSPTNNWTSKSSPAC